MIKLEKAGIANRGRIPIAIGIVGALAIGGWCVASLLRPPVTLSKVTVALPLQVSVGAFHVGQDQKIFEKHGLGLTINSFILGKDALQSVLQGKADLAVLADTPFMFAVMKGEKIATVATVFGSRRTMAIVGRVDRGIKTASDLRHKTIGTIFGTNAQYFVDTFLLANSVSRSDVTIVNLPVGTIAEALLSGKVDAVTAWHPDLANMQQVLGGRVTTLYGEDIFVYRFILVATRDYLTKHPAQVRALLAALDESISHLQAQPAQARALIGKSIGIAPALLDKAFDPKDFSLTLDQTLLLALGAETRWAMKQGHVAPGEIPNYLEYVDQEPLKSVLPNAVRIIQ